MHKNESIRSAAKRSSDNHACAPLTGSVFFQGILETMLVLHPQAVFFLQGILEVA
jgi:hypothetical protein